MTAARGLEVGVRSVRAGGCGCLGAENITETVIRRVQEGDCSSAVQNLEAASAQLASYKLF
ncbi:hypothetical protein VE23_16660 [Paenibacillus sp. D9]|nr:hypothetical protein VE23_16660 [Paenibacillus sp. D9]CDN41518.1 hypothetical protein BN871_AI_00290 [Paenibacillus sp. P22]